MTIAQLMSPHQQYQRLPTIEQDDAIDGQSMSFDVNQNVSASSDQQSLRTPTTMAGRLNNINTSAYLNQCIAQVKPSAKTRMTLAAGAASVFGPVAAGAALGTYAGSGQVIGDTILNIDANRAHDFLNDLIGNTTIGVVLAIPGVAFLACFGLAKSIQSLVKLVQPKSQTDTHMTNSAYRGGSTELANIIVEANPEQARLPESREPKEPWLNSQRMCNVLIATGFGSSLGIALSMVNETIGQSIGEHITGWKPCDSDDNINAAAVGAVVLPPVIAITGTFAALLHDRI